MVPKKLIVSLLGVAAMIAVVGISACGSGGTEDKTTEETMSSRTITTPGGNLTIESVEIKPHAGNPDKQWVTLHLVPAEGTTGTASTIYESIERESLILRTEDEQEKAATSISQSDKKILVGFITDKTVAEYTMLWPGNDPVRLDSLIDQ